LLSEGAIELTFASHRPNDATVGLTAIGAYQLREVLIASARLTERNVPHRVVYMLEPGRFRAPRSDGERGHGVPPQVVADLYRPTLAVRLFVTHTRPEPLLGLLAPLNTGPGTAALGYIGHGGTADVEGLLFLNRCTWAHVLLTLARLEGRNSGDYLMEAELAALEGRCNPRGVVIPRVER
jgi:phosphoketolase